MNHMTKTRERSASGRLPFNLICGGISHLLSAAIALFLTPLLLSRLGVELYGFYRTALEAVTILGLFSGLLGSTVSRYVAVEYAAGRRENAKQFFSTVFWGQLALLGILAVPSVLFVVFCDSFLEIPNESLTAVRWLFVWMLGAGFVDAGSSVFGSVYTATGRLDFRAAQELSAVLVKAVLLWVLFGGTMGVSPVGVGVAIFVSSVVGAILRVILARWLLPEFSPSPKYCKLAALKRVAASGIWYSVYELGTWLPSGAFLLVASLFLGAEQAGVFSVSLTASHFFGGIIAMLAGLFIPSTAKRYAVGEHEALTDDVIKGEKLVGFFSLIGVSLTVGFLPEFFEFWLGAENTPLLRLLTVLMVVPCLSAAGALPIFNLAVVMNRLWRIALFYVGGSLLGLGAAIGISYFTELGVLGLGVLAFGVRVLWHSVFMPLIAGRLLGINPLRFYLPVLRTYLGAALSVVGIWGFKHLCVIGSVFSLAAVAFVCACAVGVVGYLCVYGRQIPKI